MYQENVIEFVTTPIASGSASKALNTSSYYNGVLMLRGTSDLAVQVQGVITKTPGATAPADSDWVDKDLFTGQGFHAVEPIPSLIRLKVTAGTLTYAAIDASADTTKSLAAISGGNTSAQVSELAADVAAVQAATAALPALVDNKINLTQRLLVQQVSRNAPYTLDFTAFDTLADIKELRVLGTAVASLVSGQLNVTARWDNNNFPNRVIINRTFGEGRFQMQVVKGSFMVGVHTRKSDNAAWSLWSSDGSTLEFGYIYPGGFARNPWGTLAIPGNLGDLVNVELEIGVEAVGRGFNIRAWLATGARPDANGLAGSFQADGTDGMVLANEGFISIASFGTDTTKIARITLIDGSDKSSLISSQVEFGGRWADRYESYSPVKSTIRQGSYFRFYAQGTAKVTATFFRAPENILNPIVALYRNGTFDKYLEITADTIDLYTDLDPAVLNRIEVRAAGIHENDAKWISGAGLTIRRLYAYAGLVAPWPDTRPKILLAGDSIMEGVAAKGTPGVSIPSNSIGDRSWGVLGANELGMQPVMSGFGGTGLTVAGSGSVPALPVSVANYMNGRPINTQAENIRYMVTNIGTNDLGASVSTSAFQTAYVAYINLCKKLFPGVRHYAMRPFNGAYATQIQAAANLTGITYIDTTGWVTLFQDGTHPTEAGAIQAKNAFVTFMRNDLISE